MMDPNPATLKIDIRPSLILSSALSALHFLALAAAWVSLTGWAQYLVVSGVLLSGAATLGSVLQLLPAAVMSLELHADGRASWRDRRGGWHQGGLGGGHYVSWVLVVVGLRPAERRIRRLVLAADSAPPEDMRRLRVWLRWRGNTR
jgi:hypothetical protein